MAKTATGITRGKLTKKFLKELSTNSYLVSNCGHNKYSPIYENLVVAMPKRENQWNEIKQAYANNRLCRVFRNKSDYRKWKSKFTK